MARKPKLTDEEILRLGLEVVHSSNSYQETVLAREIRDNIRYYLGELPGPQRGGTSTYVSQDVWDVVESLKAQLLETFSGNRIVVRFAPLGAGDVEQARIATEVVNYVYGRYNNGFCINRDVIHNGLMARNGIVKVYWEKKEEESEERFEGVSLAQLGQVLMDPNVELDEDSLIQAPDGSYSGVIERKYDASNVVIEVVPPEDFIISTGAVCKHTAEGIGTRTLKSRSDLLKLGYDKKKVESLGSSEATLTDPVKVARFGNQLIADNAAPLQDSGDLFYLYELFLRLDKNNDGIRKLYKVVCCDKALFECEEVDSIPLFSFAPLPIPHSFYGANFIDRASHIQRAKTTITRGILEHTVITNNPRYQVLSGGVSNPRELIDNRLGGIVNVNRPDAITPLEQPSLNPFAFSVIEKLDADKEDNTGVSRLSKGLNKDAISKQNSAEMVGDLTSLSMQRQKMIARNFAESFLKDVYLYIYELVMENAGKDYIAEVAGEFQSIDVSRWKERKDVMVEFTIGYQEDEQEFQRWLMMHTVLSQDPTLAPMYSADKKYAVLRKAWESRGVRDIESYLTPPDKAQPIPPDPIQMKELEIQDKIAQARLIDAETNRIKAEAKAKLEMADLAQRAAVAHDKQDLDERKFEHDKEMDDFEQSIVQREADAGMVTASANVNSSTG